MGRQRARTFRRTANQPREAVVDRRVSEDLYRRAIFTVNSVNVLGTESGSNCDVCCSRLWKHSGESQQALYSLFSVLPAGYVGFGSSIEAACTGAVMGSADASRSVLNIGFQDVLESGFWMCCPLDIHKITPLLVNAPGLLWCGCCAVVVRIW